ncbi:putative TetR family transcriptional regulator [Gordonia effusa NBRC 100432]|uniref:Putative TetR family transcriptional regulator n=2 Tax=Gordonia effusa TaxID=263908 RepID=H0R3I9_9ACTN|nr:putative TetR family transcriptional regulator [Gordonia effusa NBRC 100432]
MCDVAARNSPAPQAAGSLSTDDWLAVGYRLLAEDGIAALKIDRLCERAGVTRGSFYWHFATIASFRTALVESWTRALSTERDYVDSIAHLQPRPRLAAMIDWLMGDQKWLLERAMREWARHDETLAKAVGQSDLRVWKAVIRIFVDHGFDDEQASLRADLIFSAGIGSMHLAGPRRIRSSDRRDDLLDLLLRND